MTNDLIFDLGMNNGDDTDFYLRKGFRVVAVEANPALCALGTRRFASEVESGRLRIMNRAVATTGGSIELFVNDQVTGWSTAHPAWLKARADQGSNSRPILVPAVTLRDLVEECGVPYYVKADIQGMELACLEALEGVAARPKFFSISTGLDVVGAQAMAHVKRALGLFSVLGYDKFKVVQQDTTQLQKCPHPPHEGAYVDYRFPYGSSGLFGNELPGGWLDEKQALRAYRAIVLSYRFAGSSPWPWPAGWSTKLPSWRLRLFLDRVFWRGLGWYDTHAMHKG